MILSGDILFISYYPLKQGLKHLALNEQVPEILDLYPTIH